MTYQSLFIGAALHTTLEQLQRFLGVAFNHREIERVFRDAENNQVIRKIYLLHSSRSIFRQDWFIEALVEEYEPEALLSTC